jgi:type IV secretory pathway VirB3-like protein
MLFVFLTCIAIPFWFTEALAVRADSVVITIWCTVTWQTPTVNVTAGAIVTRVTETIAIVAHTVTTTIICAPQAFFARLTSPF